MTKQAVAFPALCLAALMWALCAIAPCPAQREVYYDQFDWGMAMGDPGALNQGFWRGNRQLFRYDPRVEVGSFRGAARVGNGGVYAGLLGTGDLSRLIPSNDFELSVAVRLTDFVDSGGGERNVEIAFRTDKREGYLFTIDGLNDRIRLRRQAGGFNDLVPPKPHIIHPGDMFFMHLVVEGSGPVRIQARVATDPSFSAESLIFDETVVESVWVMNNREVVLLGFTPEGPYTFDFGYFSIGEVGYAHPVSAWERRHFTDAPPMPEFVQLGTLQSYDVGTTSVVFRSDKGALQLVPRLSGTVRMDFSADGTFRPRESWSVSRTHWPEVPFSVQDGDPIVVRGPEWQVEVERDPLRPIYKSADGRLLVEHPLRRPPLAAGSARELAFSLEPGEDLYGFGQGAGASGIQMNRRGYLLRVLSTRQRLAHAIMPFWLSSRQYGVLVDNPAMGWLDLGFGDPLQTVYSSDEGELTWYVMCANSMSGVLEQYGELVGRPELPPRWSLGSVQLSSNRDALSRLHRLIEEFQIRGLPLDAVTIETHSVNGQELPLAHMGVGIVATPQVQLSNGQRASRWRPWREPEASLGGVPHWNPDLGGYWSEPSGELYLRWVQFGLFKPLFQPQGRGSIEPWSFGPEVEAAVREALELRYRLLPYHYTLWRQAHDSGIPVLRPLVLEWPEDPMVRNLGSTFLFGGNLLARPITEEHGDRVEVYLPEGRWFDWFSGTPYDGPVSLPFDGGSSNFPLFVRAPAVLPLAPGGVNSAMSSLGTLTLRIWPPRRGHTVHGSLYEDDGETLAYQEGEFATTTYEVQVSPQGKELAIRIGGAIGRFEGQPAGRRYLLEIGTLHEPKSVQFQGQALSRLRDESAWASSDQGWYFDGSTGWLSVKGTQSPIDSAQEFLIFGNPVSDWAGWTRTK